MEDKIEKGILNLEIILNDCPRNTKLYSPLYGDVYFQEIDKQNNEFPIKVLYVDSDGEFNYAWFNKIGRYYNLPNTECMLFPSKENRDWSTWKNPNVKIKHFDPKTLKPFDKVLVKNDYYWIPTILSYYDNWDKTFVTILYKEYWKCIPYNDETAHLAGTTDEAPEYYRYWEG